MGQKLTQLPVFEIEILTNYEILCQQDLCLRTRRVAKHTTFTSSTELFIQHGPALSSTPNGQQQGAQAAQSVRCQR
jgi:hypothetical protein